MQYGSMVRVKSTARGSDRRFAGRKGVVIHFDPSLGWTGPRALLGCKQFVCVHLYPKSGLEKRRGGPIVMFNRDSLTPLLD